MDRFAPKQNDVKHDLALALNRAWVECSVDPALVAGDIKLPGEVALQNSLYVYGLISTEPGSGTIDGDIEARCKRFGISWIRCAGKHDIQRCVSWAIRLQDEIGHCQARNVAA